MIPYTTYDELIINLRKALIEQTDLNGNRIINAVSVRGPALRKLLSDTTTSSINLHDVFIIFELHSMQDETNIVLHDEEDNSDVYSKFKLMLKIYGNYSQTMSNIILGRFKTAKIINELYDKGIWIRNVSFPETINEFINETVWPRCDMEIDVIVRFKVDQLEKPLYAESIKNLIVVSNGE